MPKFKPKPYYKTVSSTVVDVVCSVEFGDVNHSWPLYAMNKVEAALKKHGYISEGDYYKAFDTDKEELLFCPSITGCVEDYSSMVFRLKIADFFFRIMKWCYYNFRPV